MSRKRRMALHYLMKHSRKKRAIRLGLGTGSDKLVVRNGLARMKRFTDDEFDISQLGDKASKYSQLLNNLTLEDNSTAVPDVSAVPLEPYEAAIIYDKTEFILTNLKAFQEYSIEVCYTAKLLSLPAWQLDYCMMCMYCFQNNRIS